MASVLSCIYCKHCSSQGTVPIARFLFLESHSDQLVSLFNTSMALRIIRGTARMADTPPIAQLIKGIFEMRTIISVYSVRDAKL